MKDVRVSKEDLVAFARGIYSQALNGHKDLEESVCFSEADRFYDVLSQKYEFHLGSITLSTASDVCWTVSPSGSAHSLNCDPYWATASAYGSAPGTVLSSCGFSSPTPSTLSPPFQPSEKQLLLFKSLDSNKSVDTERFDDSLDGELFSNNAEGNEGHIFFLGGNT